VVRVGGGDATRKGSRHGGSWEDPPICMISRFADSGLLDAFAAEVSARHLSVRAFAMVQWFSRHQALLTFLALIGLGIAIHYFPESWFPWHWIASVARPLS